MAEQKQSGLGGTKPRPQLDALGKFRMAAMPDRQTHHRASPGPTVHNLYSIAGPISRHFCRISASVSQPGAAAGRSSLKWRR